jgi:SAM-dependent methyltransferase
MSDGPVSLLPAEVREKTLARFEAHRRAWRNNRALRACYSDWYGLIRKHLPAASLGPWIEIGSGPGFAKELIPELTLTDIVQAPWHERQVSAEVLPFEEGTVGALVLFDVLHHVAVPTVFLHEADRVLRLGGRIVLVEPYVSPLSHVVYNRFHEEPAILSVDPFAQTATDADKDPFTSNQAIPTLLFSRGGGRRFEQAFPNLAVTHLRRFAGLAYPATGGFNRGPLLPFPLWRALYWFESLLPEIAFRLFGFRMLVVIEKRGPRY